MGLYCCSCRVSVNVSILGMRYKGLMLVSILCISELLDLWWLLWQWIYKNGEIHMEWPISGVLENWSLWAMGVLLGTILLVFFS